MQQQVGIGHDGSAVGEMQRSVAGRATDLIEKDLACIDGTDEQNADTFPNPLIEESKLSEISAERGFSP